MFNNLLLHKLFPAQLHKLYEWGFDVNGGIGQGFAIDLTKQEVK